MIEYAIHVIPRSSVEHWLILLVLLAASVGGSWGYLHFAKAYARQSIGSTCGMVCCVSIYTSLILWVTLFLRTPGTAHQANLIPLWSWYRSFLLGDDEIRWQIYFNVLLFMPFGFFAYLANQKSLRQILLQVFLLSLFVEVCQYIFCLGLFEWDDLLHNSLGGLVGGACARMVKSVWKLHRLHKTSGRKFKE